MAGSPWALRVEVMSVSNLLDPASSRVTLSLDGDLKATTPTKTGINPAFNYQYEVVLDSAEPALLTFQVFQQGGVLGSWREICATRLGLEPELYLARQVLPLSTSQGRQSCGTILVVSVQTAPVTYAAGAAAFEVPSASAPPASAAVCDVAGEEDASWRPGVQGQGSAPAQDPPVNFATAAGQGYPLRALVRAGSLPAELAGGSHTQNLGWLRVGFNSSNGDYSDAELWAETCKSSVRRAAFYVLQPAQSYWQELASRRMQARRAAGGAMAGSSVEEAMAGLQVLRVFLGHLSRGTLPQGPTIALALKAYQGELDLHQETKLWWVRVPSAGVVESWGPFDYDAAYQALLETILQELIDLGHEPPAATGGPRPCPMMLFNPELGYIAKNEELLEEFLGGPYKCEVADASLSMSLNSFKKDVQWQIVERPSLTVNLMFTGMETYSHFVELNGNFFWRAELGPQLSTSAAVF
jgi:hypothetical protein